MTQARTLKDKELNQVLGYVTRTRHKLRNRVMLLCTYHAGFRVGEVAALQYGDVVQADGSIAAEVRLAAEKTKGNRARTVFLPEKLRKELAAYVKAYPQQNPNKPLFYTQKREGFSANTLAQHFFHLYHAAGLAGASSHSGRRTFITTLANKGIGVRVLQSLAGHRNISTTQAYIEINDEMLRSAVSLI